MALTINQPNYAARYMATNNKLMQQSSQRLASGKKINSAKDDAAGIAIMNKIESLIRGIDQGTDNSYDMQNLMRTAEGGLDTMSDALLRVRNLALQSQNGIYTDEDKALLQHEVDQMIDHVNTTAQNAQFNNKNLLDGSFTNQHTASDAHGNGMDVTINDMGGGALGITGFDITKDFDLGVIDKALSAINSERANLGASMNRLDYTIESNMTQSLNQAQSLSRIADADMAKETMNYSQSRIIQQYQIFAMKRQMAGMSSVVNFLL